jgi:hypothetical protein
MITCRRLYLAGGRATSFSTSRPRIARISSNAAVTSARETDIALPESACGEVSAPGIWRAAATSLRPTFFAWRIRWAAARAPSVAPAAMYRLTARSNSSSGGNVSSDTRATVPSPNPP